MKDKIYMVFDVESVGLHGEGFAYGFVVTNHEMMVAEGSAACNPENAIGLPESLKWVKANVSSPETMKSPIEVRNEFWSAWMRWKKEGAILVADCAWPVEAKFLAQCVSDDIHIREWNGPYPLHDLATMLLMKGVDPLRKFPRRDDELPEHNPINDARQSARILRSILTDDSEIIHRLTR